MTFAVYVPIAVCVLLCLTAGRLSTRLPPGSGTWTVALAAVVGAGCTVWALALLALSLIDDVPSLTPQPDRDLPVADWISGLAALALAVCAVRLTAELHRQRRLRRELRPLLALPGGELLVLPDGRARAFAIAGRPGRVVVTDAMLRVLTPRQRRVLMAHERAHLAARHPSALALAHLAAAANPLLVPAARAVGFLSERHADERAALAVGDRRLAADAVATAALAMVADRDPAPNFHKLGVVERVAALHAPPKSGYRVGPPLVALAGALAVFAIADATDDLADLARLLLRH